MNDVHVRKDWWDKLDYTPLPIWFFAGCYIILLFYYLDVRGDSPSMQRVRACYLVMSAFIVACLLFDLYWLSLIAPADRLYNFTLLALMALGAASLFFFDIMMQLIDLRRMRMSALQK